MHRLKQQRSVCFLDVGGRAGLGQRQAGSGRFTGRRKIQYLLQNAIDGKSLVRLSVRQAQYPVQAGQLIGQQVGRQLG